MSEMPENNTLENESITEEVNPAVKDGKIDLTQYQGTPKSSHSLPKRIAAWICIIILGGLYLSTLIMAIAGVSIYNKFFVASLIGTLVVPIFAFVVVWLIGRYTDRQVMGDPKKPE